MEKSNQKVIKPPPKVNQPIQNKGNKKQGEKIENCSEFLFERYGGVSGPDTHLIQMLEREVITPTAGVTINDIADL